jgi:Mg/Co/Ni transporter MgtE
MAKILERITAQDASALVAAMTDVELEAVLRAMDAAKAGDLIAALPTARGATLTKRLLAPAGTP